MNGFLGKIVAWLNAGYPEGVPGPDRVPLLALLRRRLTEDEVKIVGQDLIDRGEFDHVDIGVLITQITDELPTPEEFERVRAHLADQRMAARRPPRRRGDRIAVLRPIAVPAGPSALSVLPALEEVLAGRGSALLPVPADDERQTGDVDNGFAGR